MVSAGSAVRRERDGPVERAGVTRWNARSMKTTMGNRSESISDHSELIRSLSKTFKYLGRLSIKLESEPERETQTQTCWRTHIESIKFSHLAKWRHYCQSISPINNRRSGRAIRTRIFRNFSRLRKNSFILQKSKPKREKPAPVSSRKMIADARNSF